MNKYEALEILEEAARKKARSSLNSFIKYTKPEYDSQWFHKVICQKCEMVLSGEIKKLMIFVPPQHGKSEIISRKFPAFSLGVNPDLKIANCAYSSDLSEGFSRDNQRTIDSPEYHELFPDTVLNGSNGRSNSMGGYLRTVEKFEIVNHNGSFKAVGVCGPLTGNPVDIGIIDDPVKDAIEANSMTYRERVWDWYVNVFMTRLHNDSRQILMMTRWHEDDLAGRLLKLEPEAWHVVTFRGIAEEIKENDPRQIGESLWENKHSKDKLLQLKSLSQKTFYSLIQQNPQPIQTGGEYYKMFEYTKHVKECFYNPNLPIHLTFDFNVRPGMHGGAWQIINKKAYKVKEFITKSPRNNSKGICSEFMRWAPEHNHGLFIYGDPSGKNEDTRSEEGINDYSIIQKELYKYKPTLRIASSHPNPKMRADFINTIFEHGVNGIEIIISPDCHKTIDDLTFVKEDENGGKVKEKVRDPETGKSYEKYGHLSDADDYFLTMCFANDYAIYKSGKSSGKILGSRPLASKNAY
jgi:hypothetical protein